MVSREAGKFWRVAEEPRVWVSFLEFPVSAGARRDSWHPPTVVPKAGVVSSEGEVLLSEDIWEVEDPAVQERDGDRTESWEHSSSRS